LEVCATSETSISWFAAAYGCADEVSGNILGLGSGGAGVGSESVQRRLPVCRRRFKSANLADLPSCASARELFTGFGLLREETGVWSENEFPEPSVSFEGLRIDALPEVFCCVIGR
jgi:hypothetical protein